MQISLETASTANRITAYGSDFLQINDQRLSRSLLVTANDLWVDWGPNTYAQLQVSDLEFIAALNPEVVLIGTGHTQHFPDNDKLACLLNANIGVEIMDTPAACRTYNILMSEDRHVAAALIIDSQ